MRKLIESTLVSLDGVVESPQKWALPLWNEDNRRDNYARLSDIDALLFARVTYEIFAVRPRAAADDFSNKVDSLPKYVASTTLKEATWENSTLLKGDVAAEISKLKQQPGKNIMKFGTSQLDCMLINHHLIDEFQLSIFPVVVGCGRRLFEGIDVSHLHLRLTNTKTFDNGLVVATYVPIYTVEQAASDEKVDQREH